MDRVLVIEDSDLAAKTLVDILGRFGYDARWEPNGTAALQMIQEWGPAAVILDRHLPDIDGVKLARQLRRNLETKNVRIVMMSGDPLPAKDRSAIDAFLLKPASIRAVIGALSSG